MRLWIKFLVNKRNKEFWTLSHGSVSVVPVGLSPSAELPPGLVVLTDFVTEEEERTFLSAVDWGSSPGGEYHYILFCKQNVKNCIEILHCILHLLHISYTPLYVYTERSELKHRQVKHFGFEFKYGINDVDADDPLPQGIPPVCSNFLQRALATGHVTHYPDQLTVNQYQPGQGRKLFTWV